MARGPRHTPALVLVALVAAAGLGVWLLGESERPGDPRGRTGARQGPGQAPRVDLDPGASPAARAAAVERARGTGGVSGPGGERSDGAARREGDLRDVDPPPAIRGVRGLVREAASGRPIAGAWVTWRYPHPQICEEVFASGSLREAGAGEMVTDAEGRFDLQRLPDDEGVASTLFAVARGFGVAALRPGLREEVVFDLERGGTLEVHLRGPERLGHEQSRPATTWGTGPVSIEPADEPAGAFNLGEFPGQRDGRWIYRAPNLARGDYRVRVLGRDVGVTTIEPGATRIVEATHPADLVVTGTLAGREDDDAEVILRALDWLALHSLEVDGAGGLSGTASEGRFAAALYNAAGSEWPLGEVEVRAGGPPLRLEAPPRGDPVEVMLRGAREAVRTLGLVALDQGDLVALTPDPARPDVNVGRARPGRHALLDGPTLLGLLTLPAGGLLVVDATPFTAAVRFELPRALRPNEVVRGRAALVPEVLAGRPRLRAEIVESWARTLRLSHDAPRLEVELVVPGRYLLVGETDLGPFEAWVDLAPGAERVLELSE